MAIKMPKLSVPGMDAQVGRAQAVLVAYMPNIPSSTEVGHFNFVTPLVIGAGNNALTDPIDVRGFNAFTVVLSCSVANMRLIYAIVDPKDNNTTLTEVVVGDTATFDGTRYPFDFGWTPTTPRAFHTIRLKFTGVGGAATTLNSLDGLWLSKA